MSANTNDRSEPQKHENRVFHAAKQTLLFLAGIGDTDSLKIISKLGRSQLSQSDMVTQEHSCMDQANLLSIEIRYRTMMELALRSGVENFVDLPCGYTPRSLECADLEIPYTGIDLGSVINEIAPIIDEIATPKQRKYIRYSTADALNLESLEKALDGVNGPICISTEGLMIYLNNSEMDTFCANIAYLLRKYGGSWITIDPNSISLFMAPLAVVFWNDMLHQAMKNKYSSTARDNMSNDNCFIYPNNPEQFIKARDMLKKHSLKLEELPVSDYISELNSYSVLTPEQIGTCKNALAEILIWRMTLDESAL